MKNLQFIFLSLIASLVIISCNGGSGGGSTSSLPYGNYSGSISPSLQTGVIGSSESITLTYTASGTSIVDAIQTSTILVNSGSFTNPLSQNLGSPCFTGTMGANSSNPNANIYFYGCSMVNNGSSTTFTAQSFQVRSSENNSIYYTGSNFSLVSY